MDEDIEAQGFQWLNITPCHAQALFEPDAHHSDSFDRLLIAQLNYGNLKIVTSLIPSFYSPLKQHKRQL
jgi:PIN domain nuclease of toxin-antitoxin system